MKEKMTQMLEGIKKELIFMANEVEDAIYKSLQSLEHQDRLLAEEVIANDKKIDLQEVHIEDLTLALMALQQPVAIDLRFIIGALKMNNDLERIGDHAVNIAKITLRHTSEPYIKPLEDIPRLGKLTRAMLHDAVHAFINQAPDLARDVCVRDDDVDKLFYKIRADVIEVLKEKEERFEQGLDLIAAARDLERVADLATNISEDVVFMKEARIIRHGLG